MNGPAHYLEAERVLRQIAENTKKLAEAGASVDLLNASASAQAAVAQIHATLALAAAQAGLLMREWVEGEDDAIAWVKAVAT